MAGAWQKLSGHGAGAAGRLAEAAAMIMPGSGPVRGAGLIAHVPGGPMCPQHRKVHVAIVPIGNPMVRSGPIA